MEVCYTSEGSRVLLSPCTSWPWPGTCCRAGPPKPREAQKGPVFLPTGRRYLCFGNKHLHPSSGGLDAHTHSFLLGSAHSIQADELTSPSFPFTHFAAEVSFSKATSIKSYYSARQRGLPWTCLGSYS